MPETLQLRKIRLRNWKSFKDCTIELNKGLNVLVGPNGSGKTNLLEAFKFLRKALGKLEAPYAPHLEWWTYRNIVYGNDETKPILFELEFECPEDYTARYEVAFAWTGSTVKPIYEKFQLDGVLTLVREGDTITIEYEDKFLKKINGESVEKRKTYTMRYDITSIFYLWQRFLLHLGGSSKLKGNYFVDYFMVGPGQRLKIFSPMLVEKRRSLFSYTFVKMKEFFEEILFIRHLEMGALRTPLPLVAPLPQPIALEERGGNLSLVLFRWIMREGRLPDRIDAAVKNLFPEFTVSFEQTLDGRVFLLVKDAISGAVLHPPSIPDGFYKMLHVISAIEIGPLILLIDELENSLHAEVLEYVVEELKDSGITSIVATHSPVVVDVAGLEHLLLVERTAEGSKVKRVKNLEEMKKWMREKGLTPSEMWLAGM
jgi:predicted ATPase